MLDVYKNNYITNQKKEQAKRKKRWNMELERPVVPHFVADWYEEHKDKFEYSVQCLCVQGYKPLRQIDVWFDKTKNKPIETLVMMHKLGYEVEKEEVEQCNQKH